MPSPLKTVYFDFGGVITSPQSPALKKEIWDLLNPGGISEEEFWRIYFDLRHAYDGDEISVEEYWDRVGEAVGKKLDRETVRRIIEIDDRSWSVINQKTLDWAAAIRKRGISVGILSNMPKRFFEMMLKPASWIATFDHLVISGTIGLIKPEAAIFRYACELARCRPEEALFFDDTEKNVTAARSFGMRAYHFKGFDSLPGEAFRDLPPHF